MNRHLIRLAVMALSLILVQCGGRSLPGGGSDGASPKDHATSRDTHTTPDKASRPDRAKPKPDLGPTPTFCQGGPAAAIDGKPVKVDKVISHMDVVASCCGPGELINFKIFSASGSAATISLQVARFPNVPLPSQIKLDLANPPKGWLVALYCYPSSSCGMAHSSSHAFSGWLELKSLLGAPAVEVSACLEATPTNPITPNKHAIKLWAGKVVVNKVCVPTMHQTCNFDPMISSLRGACNPDSTCTCNPGAKKMPNGKCQ